MRLGLRPTVFQPDTEWSQVRQLYGGAEMIWERHRHRYEVNPAYVDRLEAAGLRFTGKDEKGERMQVAELKGSSFRFRAHAGAPTDGSARLAAEHPYFAGLQAHPEFCTRPLNPSPAYLGFIAAAAGPAILAEQIIVQKNYVSPHPKSHLRVPSPVIAQEEIATGN